MFREQSVFAVTWRQHFVLVELHVLLGDGVEHGTSTQKNAGLIERTKSKNMNYKLQKRHHLCVFFCFCLTPQKRRLVIGEWVSKSKMNPSSYRLESKFSNTTSLLWKFFSVDYVSSPTTQWKSNIKSNRQLNCIERNERSEHLFGLVLVCLLRTWTNWSRTFFHICVWWRQYKMGVCRLCFSMCTQSKTNKIDLYILGWHNEWHFS